MTETTFETHLSKERAGLGDGK